ncbi:MAG: rRNA maturation RNase YbeY [Rhodovibrionaceae bacterium]
MTGTARSPAGGGPVSTLEGAARGDSLGEPEDPSESPIAIDCALRCAAWAASLPEAEALARRAAAAALAAGGVDLPRGGELSLALSDDAELQILNKAYRGKDGPTNVLSFPGDPLPETAGQPYLLGDVVLALGVCAREAAAQGKTLADHLTHLVVHGVLHLLGQDHESDAEAARMEALEVRILAGLGIADPYASAAQRESHGETGR